MREKKLFEKNITYFIFIWLFKQIFFKYIFKYKLRKKKNETLKNSYQA